MPFIITWDEANPTNATLGVNIDDELRNLKIGIRERMVGAGFTDFHTNADRVTVDKLMLGASGINFRDSTDSTTLASISATGAISSAVALIPHAFCFNATPVAGAPVIFNSEIADTHLFHDNAVNNHRLTIPAGQNGTYVLIANFQLQLWLDTTGLNTITFAFRKNAGNVKTMQFQNRDQAGIGANNYIFTSGFMIHVLSLVATDFIDLNYTNASINGTVATNVFFGLFKL